MSKPVFRVALVSAAFFFGSTAPRAALAQWQYQTQQPLIDKFFPPNPLHLPTDYLNQLHDQHRLQRDRARLQADLDRGDAVAINRDMNRIQRDQRFLYWDRRDIQLDSLQRRDPWLPRQAPIPMGATLIPHPQYPGFGYLPADPTQLYALPQGSISPASTPSAPVVAPARVPVVIRNSGQPGAAVDYVVDGVTYRIDGGGAQELAVSPSSTIVYERGGASGARRYSLTAGVYEFRSERAEWALYRLPQGQ